MEEKRQWRRPETRADGVRARPKGNKFLFMARGCISEIISLVTAEVDVAEITLIVLVTTLMTIIIA